MRTRAKRVAVVAGLCAGVVAGCENATEPEPLDAGELAFEWTSEGETSGTAWTASGSCGSVGFDLGEATCAVGSDEGAYWAALAVFTNDDGTYDLVEVVHPADQTSCEATFTPGSATTCYMQFQRGRVDFPQDPVPTYVTTSGTIAMTIEGEGEDARLVGTFEGVAEDFSQLELPPITITGGAFDVDVVQ